MLDKNCTPAGAAGIRHGPSLLLGRDFYKRLPDTPFPDFQAACGGHSLTPETLIGTGFACQ
jgi:hypothetical protein